jgi:cell division transport system permease protein
MSGASIIPIDAQPMRTLTLAMAVMCYLATLALGALMLVEAAVAQWTSGMSSEVTVQLSPMSSADTGADIDKALAILSATPGVLSARPIDKADAAELLKPWLGEAPLLDELPLPALIAVAVDRGRPPDLAALEQRLSEKIKGVSIDSHTRWQSQLIRTASTLRHLSFAILGLIALSATALVIFATRSVLDANRGVIEVLHLVGAHDGFIARSVKGRFLRSGFLAGLLGTVGGIATFALLGLIGRPVGSSSLAEASTDLLISAPSVAVATYAVFLLVPVCATLLSLVTAHLAVMRQLRGA